MRPEGKAEQVLHRLGTGGAPMAGLSGDALVQQFTKVVKKALTWRHSAFTEFIEKNGSCPMCDQEIVLASVRKMPWNPKVSRLT